MVFAPHLLDRLHKRALLYLHHETDSMPRLTATETFVDTLARTDSERTGLLVVERAQTYQVGAATVQRNVITYHLFYLGGSEHTVYGLARNQGEL